MKNKFIFYFVIFYSSFLNLQAQHYSEDEAQIRAAIQQQLTDWNSGNMDGFMDGYWRSDSLQFVTAKGVTKGWDAVYNNYKKAYPNPQKMGKLSFEVLNIVVYSPEVAHLVGKWSVTTAEPRTAGGYFSLIFQKIQGRWLIVLDHTS